jgi:hypothetical protein
MEDVSCCICKKIYPNYTQPIQNETEIFHFLRYLGYCCLKCYDKSGSEVQNERLTDEQWTEYLQYAIMPDYCIPKIMIDNEILRNT